MASNLGEMSPITVSGRRLPNVYLFGNIPTLHRILEEVVKDWLRAVEPYQVDLDKADKELENIEIVHIASFMNNDDVLTLYLKCLFSYAFFFVATENVYRHFYSDLNKANRLLGLNIRHGKPPKETPFVEKIRRIRNNAVAHLSDTSKVAPIDSIAAASWSPNFGWKSGETPDLEKLTYGWGTYRGTDDSGQSVESQDLRMSGLEQPHTQHLMPYLEQYDSVCQQYLEALHNHASDSQ